MNNNQSPSQALRDLLSKFQVRLSDLEKRQVATEAELAEEKQKNARLLQQTSKRGEDLSAVINFARLGRLRYPDKTPIEDVRSALLTNATSTGSNSFGATEAEFSVEFKFDVNARTFLWGIDFSLHKEEDDTNLGLLNTYLPLSGEAVPLYPFAVGAGQTDWRYTGRDFKYAYFLQSGSRQTSSDWRASAELRRSPYGYVLPEEVEISPGELVIVKAAPLGARNMWTNNGDPQNYILKAYLRTYRMDTKSK